jgi:hypothetical protein
LDCISLGRLVAKIMNFDNVVVFGDSWPAGEELKPGEKTFGEIIANHYNSKFYNYAQVCTSIEHMLLQADDFLKNKTQIIKQTTCAVFFLTDIARSIFWDSNKQIKSIRVIGDVNKYYYKQIYSEELATFKANQALLAVQRMCQVYDLHDFYIVGWTKFPMLLSGTDLNKVYEQGNSTCLDMFKVYDNDPTDDPNFMYYDYNHYIRPNQCHPNQLGHQTIANNLIKWIDQYYGKNQSQ